MKRFVAIIKNSFGCKEGGFKTGVAFRRFEVPQCSPGQEWDATVYYMKVLDHTSELLAIVPEEDWLGEVPEKGK